ncbi:MULTISPECIES: hypothetical protein [Pasteurellaceae]|uniref:Uncharacterized protein n=1 Tax=Pasteurella atlantica TaxID=2827233 RepID=A0AAW8CPZ3_9PAST|nr:hypothetical protein [Pasteurella atlantica]MBR0573432.1 hypothetical protein [Pasteurella atlantica]MDP8039433.1 hypothetical protein [Pasteurella atlantica]MDP8041524.1 hypothetical protein [Pasteurella atlantica]MDP8043661.1 hypothetical protein [Pasteurella atlantica]MDP8045842.1 hypothetical protein [Pasteurella atlantica]
MLGDKGVEIYLSKEQWRSSRPDLDFSKITLKEINGSWHHPTMEEFNNTSNKIKGYPKTIKFEGRTYQLSAMLPKLSLGFYKDDSKLFTLFSKQFTLYYDNKSSTVITHSIDVNGRYPNYINFGVDYGWIQCRSYNWNSMMDIVNSYFDL